MPLPCRLRATRLSAALLLALALIGPSVGAQARDTGTSSEAPLRMTWESDDAACSGDDVVARALRMVTPGVVPRPLRARVEVRREAEQWLVRLQTESGDQSGRRILRAVSCAELKQALALLLAMTMESKGDVLPGEPAAPPASSPSPTSPAPAAPPPAGTVPVGPPSAAPETPRPEVHDTPPAAAEVSRAGVDIGWFARVDGKAASGLMPGLALGVGISAGVTLGAFDVGVGGAFWPETRASVLNRSGGVNVLRRSFGLRLCWNAWRSGGFVLAPCVAPELTFFRYASEDVADSRSGTAGPLASLTGSADLRYELIDQRLSVLLSPGLTWEKPQPFQIHLTDEPTQASEATKFYTTRGFAPRLEIGVDARF